MCANDSLCTLDASITGWYKVGYYINIKHEAYKCVDVLLLEFTGINFLPLI